MSKPMEVKVMNSEGLSFGSLLFLLFLGLKLGHVINWSWWWVTAPLWIPVALSLVIFAVVAGIVMLVAAVKR